MNGRLARNIILEFNHRATDVHMYFLLCDLDRCGCLNKAKMNEPIILDKTADMRDPLIYSAVVINTNGMFSFLNS